MRASMVVVVATLAGCATVADIRAAMSDATENIRVCGTVNAKNSFGGYVGPQRFIGHMTNTSPPLFAVADIASPKKGGDFAINLMCSQAGL